MREGGRGTSSVTPKLEVTCGCIPTAEETGLNPAQCGFESHHPHQQIRQERLACTIPLNTCRHIGEWWCNSSIPALVPEVRRCKSSSPDQPCEGWRCRNSPVPAVMNVRGDQDCRLALAAWYTKNRPGGRRPPRVPETKPSHMSL